jgi:hypothetical protein
MIIEYTEIPQEHVDRQGEAWIFCDAEKCNASEKVQDVKEFEMLQGTVRQAPMPDGWVTSDPNGNALSGAADFCPKHKDRIYVPPADATIPETIRDESSTAKK